MVYNVVCYLVPMICMMCVGHGDECKAGKFSCPNNKAVAVLELKLQFVWQYNVVNVIVYHKWKKNNGFNQSNYKSKVKC